MSGSVGEAILGWMMRRLEQGVPLKHDLVIVSTHTVLADVGASAEIRGETWRVARVTGELTLRDALPEADRLIALVPSSFSILPMDIAARTYLSRILEPRAEDVVAALSGRFCDAIVDEPVARAVFDSFDTLRKTAGRWSFGASVSAREVRTALVGAELGAARLDRERDWELLTRWLVDGTPTFRSPSLVRTALEEAQPRTGGWLAWALTDGTLQALCTAGALLSSNEGAAHAPSVPGLAESERNRVVELVDAAMHDLWRRSPARASEILIEAERVARTVALDPGRHRLLRVPLEGALLRAATRSAEGDPPDDVIIEAFKRNLHASALAEVIDAVADLARLARFLRLPTPEPSTWFVQPSRDVAWADLCYRRIRRAMETLPPWLADPTSRVLAAWLKRRDELNMAFALELSARWAAVARSTDTRHPIGLHQITRCLVRRLVDDGSRVFLLVLDGCDTASFLEIAESIAAEGRVGLALPDARDVVLRDDLSAVSALAMAISPVPTVTSHSRRALFAGDIPGNTALDNTESAAANATADHIAWERNTALGDIPRKLFLKGDLASGGQPLQEALRDKGLRVVAAVFNGVDDALSSKEMTPQPRWSFAALGAGAFEAVQLAVEQGWCVLVTADHGHTPFVSPDRKVGQGGLGQRLSGEPVEGTVAFTSGPLPRQPLHLLARFGAWFGAQRRGFHGGASIEEVIVPLAFLGRVRGEQEGRPIAPPWWWAARAAVETESTPKREPPPEPALHEPDLDPRLGSLTHEERRVIQLLRQNQSARTTAIAQHIKKPPGRAVGFMQQLIRKLFDLGVPCVVAERMPDGEPGYHYQDIERGNR